MSCHGDTGSKYMFYLGDTGSKYMPYLGDTGTKYKFGTEGTG